MEATQGVGNLSSQSVVDSLIHGETIPKDSYYRPIRSQDLIYGKITVAFGESIKKIASIFLLILPTISALNPVSFSAVASGVFVANILMSSSQNIKEPSYFEELKNRIELASKLTHKEKVKWLFLDVMLNVSFKVAAFALYQRFNAFRSIFIFAVSSYYLRLFYQITLNEMDRLIQSYLDKKREQEYIGIIN